MFIKFTADWGGQEQGFVATWQALTATATTKAPVAVMGTCAGCGDPPCEYTQLSGTLSDGPGTYSASNCKWLISTGTEIRLAFSGFDLAQSTGGSEFVAVYDGKDTSAPELGEFRSNFLCLPNCLPGSVTASSGSMLVWFSAGGSRENEGFVATWHASAHVSKPIAPTPNPSTKASWPGCSTSAVTITSVPNIDPVHAGKHTQMGDKSECTP